MKVILFGNVKGVKQALSCLGKEKVCAIVNAGNHPEYREELHALANELHVPFLIQPKKTDFLYTDWIRSIEEIAPSFCISNNYSMILPPEVLKIPRACVNLHGGILPQFRGSNPRQWTLIENKQESGCSMHLMTPKVDAGSIIAVKKFPVSLTDTWRDLAVKDQQCASDLLKRFIPKILSDEKITVLKQNETLAKTWWHRKPEDSRLTWDMNIQRIHNTVCASVEPLPGAFWQEEHTGKKIVWDKFIPLQEITAYVLKKRPYFDGKNMLHCHIVADCLSNQLCLDCIEKNGSVVPIYIEIIGRMRELVIRPKDGATLTPAVKKLTEYFCTKEFPLSKVTFGKQSSHC
jgi:methionyl-tRNA formyltransferase